MLSGINARQPMNKAHILFTGMAGVSLRDSGMVGVSTASITAYILAGGQSTRMGRDKALVPLNNKPLIEHAVGLLREIGLEPKIAGARTDLSAYATVVPDDEPDQGPLSGICTALRYTSTELALFVSVDLPLIPASLLRYLIHHAQVTGRPATVASVNGFAQTFPAVLGRDALPQFEAALQSGDTGCFAAFRTAGLSILPAELLVQSGHIADPRGLPPFRWFANVNTPTDLRALEALIA